MDLRRTMRQSLRRGGDLLDLMHRRRRRQRLKLVLICDVSKSMDLYSRFLIQFIYAFQTVYRRIETFVFSTSLHRITDQLKEQSMDEAVARLSENVPDWSGGTKIGASLRQFVDDFSLKVVDPATVVLVISDGWDTGEVELLSESMAHLKKSSRVISKSFKYSSKYCSGIFPSNFLTSSSPFSLVILFFLISIHT